MELITGSKCPDSVHSVVFAIGYLKWAFIFERNAPCLLAFHLSGRASTYSIATHSQGHVPKDLKVSLAHNRCKWKHPK